MSDVIGFVIVLVDFPEFFREKMEIMEVMKRKRESREEGILWEKN